ncbi:pilin [Patescibacteria group bacterium]|nr:pilin [Patescibacteria group bacterium]
MKRTILQFVACMLLMMAVLSVNLIYSAQAASLAIPESEEYGEIAKPNPNKDTMKLITEGLYGEDGELGFVGIFKYIMVAIAILMIVVSGLRMVIAQGEEEAITNNKKSLIVGIIGLVIISASSEIGEILRFDSAKGGPIGNPNETLARVVNFDKSVRVVITFIKYTVGSLAVLMAIKSGLVLVTQGSSEEDMTKEKKTLGISALGLILIVFADTLIRKVFYKIDTTAYPGVEGVKPALDPYRGVQEIVGITNFVVTFISPIAVLIFIIGGIMYLTAADNEERGTKAKRMMIAALVGIIVIYGAFALVSTFITGQIDAIPQAV